MQGLDAFDIRTAKANGEPWDFNSPSDRKLAREIIENRRPTWLICSPPCTAFSQLNVHWNFPKMEQAKVQAMLEEGRRHLHFVMGLCKLQLNSGRHFLFEHPAGALSWDDPWVRSLMNRPDVHTVLSDQCEYGLVTPNASGELVPAKKPTRWMTSAAAMARRLSKRCSGQHKHQPLLSGRAAAAAFYPLPLITKILRGIRDTADERHPSDDAPSKEIQHAMSRAALLHDQEP